VMQFMTGHRSWWGLAVACLLGCSDGQPEPDRPVASLESLDRWTLQTTDSSFIGMPSGFAIDDETGHFWVSDRFRSRVYRIDRQGAFRQSVGSEGEGPGEFLSAGSIAIHDGRLVVVSLPGSSSGMDMGIPSLPHGPDHMSR